MESSVKEKDTWTWWESPLKGEMCWEGEERREVEAMVLALDQSHTTKLQSGPPVTAATFVQSPEKHTDTNSLEAVSGNWRFFLFLKVRMSKMWMTGLSLLSQQATNRLLLEIDIAVNPRPSRLPGINL